MPSSTSLCGFCTSAMVAGAIGNPEPFEQPPQEVATDEGYTDKDETYREVFGQPGLKAEPREHRGGCGNLNSRDKWIFCATAA